MSRQAPNNSKRRAPGESSTDDRQDADWGFEPEKAGLSTETKLGIILVVCLLAGFSFVLYQKYRILQRETVHTEEGEPELNAPAHGAEAANDGRADADSPSEIEPTLAIDSPFYESPSEPAPSKVATDQWLLASEESGQPSVADSTPTPAFASESDDEFNPFAVDANSIPPEPETMPMPADVSTVTWDVDPPASTPPAAESAPLIGWGQPSPPGESLSSNEQPVEPSPLPVIESMPTNGTAGVAQPEAVAEPSLLDFGDPAQPVADPVGEPRDFVLDPASRQRESQSLPALPETPSTMPLDSRAPNQTSASDLASDFDPFTFAESERNEPADAAAPDQPPTPFPAPSGAAIPAERPAQAPTSTPEFPEWPASEPAETMRPPEDGPPRQREEPRRVGESPTFLFEPVADAAPPATADEPREPSSGLESSHPFSDDAAPRPVVTSIVSAGAVIGEREIVVTRSDSFWSISLREYGTARYFTALARYNRDRVPRPDELQSGMTIRIPPPEVLEATFPELFQNRNAQPGIISPVGGSIGSDAASAPSGLYFDEQRRPRYRVGQRDTLSTIAQAHLGSAARWPEIYELNRDQLSSPSTLTIGMVLKLPPDTDGAIVWPEHGRSR